MRKLIIPLAIAATMLAAPAFSTVQQPPKKKPTPPDSTRVDSTMRGHDHRVDTTTKKAPVPGKPTPTSPDSTRTQPRK